MLLEELKQYPSLHLFEGAGFEERGREQVLDRGLNVSA